MTEFPFERHRRDVLIFLPVAYCASLLILGLCAVAAGGDPARLRSTGYWTHFALFYVVSCVASVPIVGLLIAILSHWRTSVERYPVRWIAGGTAVALALWWSLIILDVAAASETMIPPRPGPRWIDVVVPLPAVAVFATMMWWRLRRRSDALD